MNKKLTMDMINKTIISIRNNKYEPDFKTFIIKKEGGFTPRTKMTKIK